MVAHVDCLRHGETRGGARYCGSTDVVLTPRGWQQMRAATDGRLWDRVVTSPLRRCADFAFELADRLALPCAQDADWREMHFGDWEGRSAEEILQSDADALERFWADPSAGAPPRSEPLEELRSRVLAAFERAIECPDPCCANAGPARILVVTHGGPIRVLYAAQSEQPLSSLLSFEVPHAALVTFRTPLVPTSAAQTVAVSNSPTPAEG
jgi:alpha-ribazole phosphatase